MGNVNAHWKSETSSLRIFLFCKQRSSSIIIVYVCV